MLTDEQRAHAELLLLTEREYEIALATHINPERYATIKTEIAAEKAATRAREEVLNDALMKRAAWMPEGRGKRPWPKEPPPEDGG
jgi:hypothetical protein